jgi:hypothetical protein
VYLVVPGYLLYQYGGVLKNFLPSFGKSSDEAESQDETPEEKKRREKKERKEKKQKFVTVRRWSK